VNERTVIAHSSVPRLAPHMRLRFDKVRKTWTIQAPERTFVLDEIAQAIVSRCDGHSQVGAIIESLATTFLDAPRDVIEKDVFTLLQNFADTGVIQI